MISIRKASESDADKIYEIRQNAILEKCSPYYSKDQLLVWTQGEMSRGFVQDVVDTFFVSECEGQVIGCGKLSVEKSIVDAIFVSPEFFGRGAARKMLTFLETLAKDHGLELLKLESTLNAASFYRSCGFVGEKYATYCSPQGVRLDCIPMEKQLTK